MSKPGLKDGEIDGGGVSGNGRVPGLIILRTEPRRSLIDNVGLGGGSNFCVPLYIKDFIESRKD